MSEGKPSKLPLVYVPCAVAVVLLMVVRTTLGVPTHFMETDRYRGYSVDLDAEQTEARYDQGMLSDIINDSDRGELQKAESCLVDNYKYDHGQKIQRLDPCEICLCIDGEIFCWWKQCDPQSKASQEFEQDHLADPVPIVDRPSDGGSAAEEVSTVINTANATNYAAARGSTRLALADTLTADGSTTVFSSTVALSTPASRGHEADGSSLLETSAVRHGSDGHHALQDALEGIPQNILSFPQSPPIMMYRPAPGGQPTVPNQDPIGAGSGGHKKSTKGPHKKAKERKKQPTKSYASDAKRKPTVSIASDALPRLGGDSGVASMADRTEDLEDRQQQHVEPTVRPESEQFGGYGFGMIHEPETGGHGVGVQRGRDRDVPQHYIITSSGHVEMFDDSGTIGGPEELPADRQDVLSFDGRVASPVEPESRGSEDASDETDDGGRSPVAPAIMLTTNVTQGRYSSTLSPAPPSSVIDILNTTNVLETDYGEGTNHSELIYPEVPADSGSVGSSSNATQKTATEAPAGSVTPGEPHCVVLGVTYPVGAEVKKVGLCMYCVCEAGGAEYDSAPRVSCTRLNCPPLILPDMLDEAGY